MVDMLLKIRELKYRLLGIIGLAPMKCIEDDNEVWRNNAGLIHRENGPAIINLHNGNVAFALNGYIYDFNTWLKKTPASNETKTMLKLEYG